MTTVTNLNEASETSIFDNLLKYKMNMAQYSDLRLMFVNKGSICTVLVSYDYKSTSVHLGLKILSI